MSPPDSSSEHTSSPSDSDAERQRRLDALRGLAEHTAPVSHPEASTPTPTSPRHSLAPPSRRLRQRTYNRWLVAISGGLCAAVLAVLVLSHLASSPKGKKAARPTAPPHAGLVTIQVANDGFSCVQDAAWNHIGDQIAVLGYSVCGNSGAQNHGLLVVYAAATGKVSEKADLDSLVTPQLQQIAGANLTDLSIVYDHVLWSPGDQALDVTFSVADDRQPNRYAVYFGLLHYSSTGFAGNPDIAVHVAPAPTTLSYAVWDFAGTLSAEPYSQPPLFSLQPWVAYTWFPPGATIPAPSPSSPFEPVGDPSSGNKFTVWQPGTLSLRAPHDTSGHPALAPIYSYSTSFAAQSQTVIIDPVVVTFRLQPAGQPAPPAETLRTFGLDHAPVFPTRDKALDALLATLKPAPGVPLQAGYTLAWRPDGTRLAAQSIPDPANPASSRNTVTIYNSASGAVLAHLTPIAESSGFNYFAASLLRWSPGGTQLALYDINLNTISVWSAPLLPA